jgi:hypothetical protein
MGYHAMLPLSSDWSGRHREPLFCYELRTVSGTAPKTQLWFAIKICDNGWRLQRRGPQWALCYSVLLPHRLLPGPVVFRYRSAVPLLDS